MFTEAPPALARHFIYGATELKGLAKNLDPAEARSRHGEVLFVKPWQATGICLRRLGVHNWYRAAAAESFDTDPWTAFARASAAAENTTGDLRVVVDLFILKKPRSKADVDRVFSKELASQLKTRGLFRADEGRYHAEQCLIAAFDELILTDWPLLAPSGRLISDRIYLSSTSYDCIRRFGDRRFGTALELGSGTGLIAVCLARQADKVLAVDIDQRACETTRINCQIAGVGTVSTLQADWRTMPDTQKFDFIVANPAWRVVPAGISYPDPVARVGVGEGGLQRVAEALDGIPSLLTANGCAVIRFDLPLDSQGQCPFDFDPAKIIDPDFTFKYETLAVVSSDMQSVVSADTCRRLNPNLDNLAAIFAKNYRLLGVSALQKVFCVIRARADRSARF